MTTFDEFIIKWNIKGIDWDGFYGFQCMDLAHQYATEVIGHDFAPALAAKDVWNQNPESYDKIVNTLDGVPQKGDIVIWGTAIGAYGHIAIFVHGDNNSFVSFDQNWPLNSLCHFQNHNYNGVLGWLHPKNIVVTQPLPGIPVLTLQTIIPKELLDGEEQGLEIQAIAGLLKDGKRDNLDLQNCRKENEELKKQYNPYNPSDLSIKELVTLLVQKIFK